MKTWLNISSMVTSLESFNKDFNKIFLHFFVSHKIFRLMHFSLRQTTEIKLKTINSLLGTKYSRVD